MNYARARTGYTGKELNTLWKIMSTGGTPEQASVVLERTPDALKARFNMLRFSKFFTDGLPDETMKDFYKRKNK